MRIRREPSQRCLVTTTAPSWCSGSQRSWAARSLSVRYEKLLIVARGEKPEARQREYTLYGSRPRAVVAPEEGPKRISVADLIIRAGAVAAAIASIAAVVALAWPDSPARQAATLSNVSRERNVSLADFTARQEVGAVAPRDTRGHDGEELEGPGTPALAVVVLAGLEGSSEGAGTSALDGGSPTTGDGGTPTTPGGEGQTGTDGTRPKDNLLPREPVRLKRPESTSDSSGVGDVRKVPAKFVALELATYGVGARNSSVAANEAQEILLGDDPGARKTAAIQSARRLLRVLRGTRVRKVTSASGSATQEVLGVTVSFDLQLDGFKGRRSDVRWSLHDARGAGRVSRDWLINRARSRCAVRPTRTGPARSSGFPYLSSGGRSSYASAPTTTVALG